MNWVFAAASILFAVSLLVVLGVVVYDQVLRALTRRAEARRQQKQLRDNPRRTTSDTQPG